MTVRRRPTDTLTILVLAVGVAMLAASGILHIYLWQNKKLDFRHVPTIGPLFLLQGIAGCVLAVVVAVWRRFILALVGAAYMAGTLAGLYKSIHGGMFGYGETLNAPWVKVSLSIETVGLAAFTAALVLLRRSRLTR